MKPRLLDLFCGAGGAAMGYQRAGFYVVGVDWWPQPNYCGDEFVQGDAMTFSLDGFDAIHASPPCQAHSTIAKQQRARRPGTYEHPDLVDATRQRLVAWGLPYVIENVPGAPLVNAILLCGSSFGRDVRRHRLFECSFPAMSQPCARCARRQWRSDWMSPYELTQAIPPAMTEHIGGYLMAAIEANRTREADARRGA